MKIPFKRIWRFVLLVSLLLYSFPISASASELPLLGGEGGLLMVGAGQAFETIQAAVDAAENGDVILVYPGVYTETVDVQQKTLTIMGTSRTQCILTYPNGNYYNPPLEMGSGSLMNMTIHATAQEKESGIIAKAYAMHTDYDISANNRLYVKNVDFINDDYQTVGIGLRKNFILEFENCRFICQGNNNAIFLHDDPVIQPSPGQRVIVRHCFFKNNGARAVIQLQSQERWGSQITCVWQNNVVVNLHSGEALDMHLTTEAYSGGGWLETSYWQNHPASRGNSVPELNN